MNPCIHASMHIIMIMIIILILILILILIPLNFSVTCYFHLLNVNCSIFQGYSDLEHGNLDLRKPTAFLGHWAVRFYLF